MGRRRASHCPAQRAFQRIRKAQEWTIEEKKSLLAAIQLHGLGNKGALQAAVPRRNPVEIHNFLALRKAEGVFRNRDPHIEAPLDQWLSALCATYPQGGLRPNCSRELCKILTLIAETEMHPPPEQCGGVDYRELYRYLADLSAGTHPKQLSPPAARHIMECCMWLSGLSVVKDMQPMKEFLIKQSRLPCSNLPPMEASYSKQQPQQPKEPLYRNKEINPLKVAEPMLVLNPADITLWGQPGFCLPKFDQGLPPNPTGDVISQETSPPTTIKLPPS